MNGCENISFKTFCDLCTEIKQADRESRCHVLHHFIEKWRRKVKGPRKTEPHGKWSFFPILRFLLPQLDRERGAYGIKENTLAKMYIRILCIPKNGEDAKKLLEYRSPKTGNQNFDFADVAYRVLKTRCSQGEVLSVNEVNDRLDTVALNHATNDPRGVDSELTALLKETSAEEQKWLIRIILKDMKLGLGQNKIFHCYHPDAQDLFDSCNDLRKICDVLPSRNVRLHEIGIEIFTPFRPMLSEECDVSKIDICMKNSSYFYIETKLDGERFQIHMNRGEFRYFSRKGYDNTSNFGKTAEEGLLTRKLARQIRSDVESIILDGEMICWNPETEQYVTKGMNTDVKNLKQSSLYQPCFAVFDILHLNGRVLTNLPLEDRIKILSDVITPKDGVISFVDRKKISKKEEVWDSLNEAIENREEGIVMKAVLSVYKPNVRRHGGWYKIKPEYTDGLMDTLDLLILGGYYGSGRRKGNISHFLLGVAVDSHTFWSAARVGSGYSMNELFELQMKLEPHWKKVLSNEVPEGLEWAAEKPDVWIEPCNSFILEVKASEIIKSDLFKTSYTLRFPRVEKVRYDKSWTDCLTLAEFHEKRKNASGKLVKRGFRSSDADISPKKRIPRPTIKVAPQYRPADLSTVERRSELLCDKEICVLSGCDNFTKGDVEKKVAEFGGTVVQNPGEDTHCVLAEDVLNVKISNIIECGSYDVIRTSWFISKLDLAAAVLPEPTPDVLLGMSKKTRERLQVSYDEYGDHFTELASRESLQHPFKVLEQMEAVELTPDDFHYLDGELFSGESPYGLFRRCSAYFDKFPIVGDSGSGRFYDLEFPEIDFKFLGGSSCESVNEETTHVVLSRKDLTRLGEFMRVNRGRGKKLRIVTEDWIGCCIRERRIVSEVEFYPSATTS